MVTAMPTIRRAAAVVATSFAAATVLWAASAVANLQG